MSSGAQNVVHNDAHAVHNIKPHYAQYCASVSSINNMPDCCVSQNVPHNVVQSVVCVAYSVELVAGMSNTKRLYQYAEYYR